MASTQLAGPTVADYVDPGIIACAVGFLIICMLVFFWYLSVWLFLFALLAVSSPFLLALEPRRSQNDVYVLGNI